METSIISGSQVSIEQKRALPLQRQTFQNILTPVQQPSLALDGRKAVSGNNTDMSHQLCSLLVAASDDNSCFMLLT